MIWLDAQGIKVEYLRSKIKIESRREIPWGEKNGESLRGSGTAGASLTESAGGIRAKVASPLKSAKNGDSASGNGKERVSGMIMRDGCSAIIAVEVSLSRSRAYASRLWTYVRHREWVSWFFSPSFLFFSTLLLTDETAAGPPGALTEPDREEGRTIVLRA